MRKNLIKMKNWLVKIVHEQRYKKWAKTDLKLINSNRNEKYKFTRSEKRKINSYSKNVLGSKKHRWWLMAYTAFVGEFKEGWLPDDYYKTKVLPVINPQSNLSEIKTLSSRLLRSIKDFPDKYYVINNRLFDTSLNLVNENELFLLDKEYFFKSNFSMRGEGVKKITKDNFESFLKLELTDGVIQSFVKQHEWFNKIMPNNVCTVRITTTNINGVTKYRAATLRIGRSDDQAVLSEKNIKVPILDDEGNLSDWGITPDYKKIYEHPDTGFKFKNNKIPYFKQMVNKCLELHKSFPYFGLLGWDLTIDSENNIRILEWNAHIPDIIFHEVAVGPCFKDLLIY